MCVQEDWNREKNGVLKFFRKAVPAKTKTHEERVERFYSHGARKRAGEAGGFLSFGYWHENTKNYSEAAENLVRFFIDNSSIAEGGTVLNVACGNGTESMMFYEAFQPARLVCIDITASHVRETRLKAAPKNRNNIAIEKRDAVKTGYSDSSFSHIVGIEGPSHFNTRKRFFAEAFRLLQNGGELILTDIVVSLNNARKKFFLPALTQFVARRWHMPSENLIDAEHYKIQLHETGFKNISIASIGDRVFNQFARNNCRLKTIAKAIKIRGFFIGIGLTIISWFLGYGYRTGVIDYIFVKAKKKEEAACGRGTGNIF